MTATDRLVAGLGLILVSAFLSIQIVLTKFCASDPCDRPFEDGVIACPLFITCEGIPYREATGAAIFLGTIITVDIWLRRSATAR